MHVRYRECPEILTLAFDFSFGDRRRLLQVWAHAQRRFICGHTDTLCNSADISDIARQSRDRDGRRRCKEVSRFLVARGHFIEETGWFYGLFVLIFYDRILTPDRTVSRKFCFYPATRKAELWSPAKKSIHTAPTTLEPKNSFPITTQM